MKKNYFKYQMELCQCLLLNIKFITTRLQLTNKIFSHFASIWCLGVRGTSQTDDTIQCTYTIELRIIESKNYINLFLRLMMWWRKKWNFSLGREFSIFLKRDSQENVWNITINKTQFLPYTNFKQIWLPIT